MRRLQHLLVSILLAGFCATAAAQEEIQLWHAMGESLGDTLNSLVQRFNASQSQYRVVAQHKGSYEDTMIGALAAQREGKGPQLVQVYEVGTATMIQAKKAVIPVSDVFKQAGVPLDEKTFVPTIASYYR